MTTIITLRPLLHLDSLKNHTLLVNVYIWKENQKKKNKKQSPSLPKKFNASRIFQWPYNNCARCVLVHMFRLDGMAKQITEHVRFPTKASTQPIAPNYQLPKIIKNIAHFASTKRFERDFGHFTVCHSQPLQWCLNRDAFSEPCIFRNRSLNTFSLQQKR